MNDNNTQLIPAAPVAAPPSCFTPKPADTLLAVIERAAHDPALDLDKFERLLAAAERVRLAEREREQADAAAAARRAYYAAMAAVQAGLTQVVRNCVNSHTSSRYADLGAVIAMVQPVYAAHGFAVSYGQMPSAIPGCLNVVCDVMHVGGHSERWMLDVPLDSAGSKGGANKTGVQAIGSTVTYARRYLTLMIFNVSTGDDDDGSGDRKREEKTALSEAQLSELLDLMAAWDPNPANRKKFDDWAGTTVLEEIAPHRFEDARKILQARVKHAREAAA